MSCSLSHVENFLTYLKHCADKDIVSKTRTPWREN